MSLHEHLGAGIYIDDEGENIWRKSFGGNNWTVNGQNWIPFPKSLTTLKTIVDGPVVSIADAVQDEQEKEGDWSWQVIPSYPEYEANVVGHVRERASKKELTLCCNQPNHLFYWLHSNDRGFGSWVSTASIAAEAFPHVKR
jgi:hypothetical protein